jgi:hypothetical protein
VRNFTSLATERDRLSLSELADPTTPVEPYRVALTQLGESLGTSLAGQIDKDRPKQICIVCTVEDADSLATGIINSLAVQGLGHLIRLVCFWNDRIDINGQSVAPILKEYREPCHVDESTLVVVKSIISSACVVRTNLSKLIADANPKRIFVVAPVMFKGADQNLAREFPADVSKRFEYLALAVDDQKEGGKWVVPGVGGDVYMRLGYGGIENKNRHTPLLVKSRRRKPLLAA